MSDADLITRRRLLAYGGAAAATAVLPGTARAARRAPAARAGWLDRDAYAGRVGETFVMRGADGTSTAVRLKSVRDLHGTTARGRSLAGRADAFVLKFKPVSGEASGDGARTFSHPQLGEGLLFAVAGTSTYTVVVNRSVPLSAASRWSRPAVRMRTPRRRRRKR